MSISIMIVMMASMALFSLWGHQHQKGSSSSPPRITTSSANTTNAADNVAHEETP